MGEHPSPAPATAPVPGRSRYDLDRAGLAELLAGEPRFRIEQVWEGLYAQGREPAAMTNLPTALRARLDQLAPPALQVATEQVADGGETIKTLWALADGALVESVLMHYRDRTTVCVSTQAGCAMACGFCATGQAGFRRHLQVGEIVEQAVRARSSAAATSRRLSNVVFMGMGEPLANYDRVWAAIRRLHDDVGLSARHLTVSTVGIVPGIRRMAAEAEPVNLAVSLHAADDELRDELVPINRRYPLDELMDACAEYLAAKNRRLSFEWALIDGVNDRPVDAARLAARARALRAHVNLIPLNATPGYPTRGTPPARVVAFRDDLVARGVNATVRRNRGTDIAAACGQLAARSPASSEQPVTTQPGTTQPGTTQPGTTQPVTLSTRR
ncbi:MAG: 23S rRNA (adenine(2503)-C(2))-methyltransferase RlmN [Acidimicrobiales bacterium]|nr:23S rRNA (adenine(2503)-C(2))-methyltransferase RlmN [Acidimicrobiales bacterium]